MKDFPREVYENVQLVPYYDVLGHINYCLDAFFADKTKSHRDNIVDNLTFEEVIGVLLQAKKLINEYKSEEENWH